MNKFKELTEAFGIPVDAEHKWPWKHNVEQFTRAVIEECHWQMIINGIDDIDVVVHNFMKEYK